MSNRDIYGEDKQDLANRVTARVIEAALKRGSNKGHSVDPYSEGKDHSYTRGRGKEDGHTEHSGEGEAKA